MLKRGAPPWLRFCSVLLLFSFIDLTGCKAAHEGHQSVIPSTERSTEQLNNFDKVDREWSRREWVVDRALGKKVMRSLSI